MLCEHVSRFQYCRFRYESSDTCILVCFFVWFWLGVTGDAVRIEVPNGNGGRIDLGMCGYANGSLPATDVT